MEDPVLDKFCTTLRSVYGPRIERIVLYGSRARGDARADSDYDIALFLHDLDDAWGELDRIVDFEFDIVDQTGCLIHAMPFPAGTWKDRTPLMHDIRRDGLDL